MKTIEITVRRCAYFVLLLIFCSLTNIAPEMSKAQQADSARKVVQKTAAIYPDLARSMALQGIVKLEVLVSPDGNVKQAEVKGGHPVLAQAALDAVRRWKWEPSSHESHETVQVKFVPK